MNELENLADEIWSYAETGFTEYKTAKAMTAFLKNKNFEVSENIAHMPTAYEAVWGKGKPVICFLAEYDALFGLNQKADSFKEEPITSKEDCGHGCGHHLLGVGAIDAALKYRDYLIESHREGTIKIVGCPAEESGSGKAYLARDGYFDDADVALTWHPGLFNMVVTGSSQSNIVAFFRFKGVAAHAASNPEMGRSALDAAELMNVGVNYLREHMEDSDRIHYAYINAGGKSPNVVQSETLIKYFVRSKDNPTVEKLYERVINCAKGAALMTGTEVNVLFDEGLSNCVSNKVLEEISEASLKKLYKFDYTKEELAYLEKFKETFDTDRVLNSLPKSVKDEERLRKDVKDSPIHSYVLERIHYEDCEAGSTDVGDVSWCVPTVQVNTACYAYGAGAHSWQWVAQGKSSIAHKGFELAGDVLCDVAKTLNEKPELIEKAKEELKIKLHGQKYKSLIPPEVMPHISGEFE